MNSCVFCNYLVAQNGFLCGWAIKNLSHLLTLRVRKPFVFAFY